MVCYLSYFLLLVSLPSCWTAQCHICFDPELLGYQKELSEVHFKSAKSYAPCSPGYIAPAEIGIKNCTFGCYELKLAKFDNDGQEIATSFLRTCANDRVISQMVANGTSSWPDRSADNGTITISSYMCTLNNCNDKFAIVVPKERIVLRWFIYGVALVVCCVIIVERLWDGKCSCARKEKHERLDLCNPDTPDSETVIEYEEKTTPENGNIFRFDNL